MLALSAMAIKIVLYELCCIKLPREAKQPQISSVKDYNGMEIAYSTCERTCSFFHEMIWFIEDPQTSANLQKGKKNQSNILKQLNRSFFILVFWGLETSYKICFCYPLPIHF